MNDVLDAPQLELWQRFTHSDQRHSIAVARRFDVLGAWSRDELAGALLHDIGKVESGLGTTMRVLATLIGPRTARLRAYHDHESIGTTMLEQAGSSPITCDLVARTAVGPAATALEQADNI